MAEPIPFDSVASLLEQLIAIAQQSLATQQQILQNTQSSNGKLDALVATGNQNLEIAQATLESSHRIEQLLGGESAPGVPSKVKVTYKITLEGVKE